MKILHIVASIDINKGGPSKSVSDLSLNQSKLNYDTSIITTPSPNPYISISSDVHLNFIEKLSYKKILNEIANHGKYDILHGHGIWLPPVHNMAKVARKNNLPYIITPRGMLEPWALNAGKWKKKLALMIYQRKDLANAACIHATAKMEAENIRKLGFRNPIAIIPNGIDLSEFPLKKLQSKKEKKTILFLSRIHPKKGIEILIEAWQQLNETLKQGWLIEIAGNGDYKYISSLNHLIQERGLHKEIKIIGPQFGTAKLETYSRADLFVLPTYSENFGIVVAEALACGVPVITTKGTPWEELNNYNAGKWIDIGVEPLKETLNKFLALSDEDRSIMGKNGRKLIEQNYSIEQVASKMIDLYKWILGQSQKPDFIY
ncbi:glycosyltransferase [Sunxiuqinia elliptica]|uniref:Glycosyltransferase involved in cell wall biosynthesis n=1 Tax=Sunxiuqinia elliptica TaxID=655355 RepID=A0A4R6GSK3_9BACT|nr:glycosyltransferase [Sunxiuqinia elliptica]TDN98223.1 glycosyltransferase involved in cell wall biosynthesis [Sunxiuqinia elliptica]TDO60330.1 glycosyltransferase involved in cell wall biosynthesis [Sunxiuqinia elliptica]